MFVSLPLLWVKQSEMNVLFTTQVFVWRWGVVFRNNNNNESCHQMVTWLVFYVCSTSKDFGFDGGRKWAVWIQSCVSSPGLPVARYPVAQHSWTSGGFLGWARSPWTRVRLPHREPAEKCGTRSTVHLQYFQPTRPRSVNSVHGEVPSPTIGTWGPAFFVSTSRGVSGVQSDPPGGDNGVDSSGTSAKIQLLLEKGSCPMMLTSTHITQTF